MDRAQTTPGNPARPLLTRSPLAQLVEHPSSNAKVPGSRAGERTRTRNSRRVGSIVIPLKLDIRLLLAGRISSEPRNFISRAYVGATVFAHTPRQRDGQVAEGVPVWFKWASSFRPCYARGMTLSWRRLHHACCLGSDRGSLGQANVDGLRCVKDIRHRRFRLRRSPASPPLANLRRTSTRPSAALLGPSSPASGDHRHRSWSGECPAGS